MKPAVDCEIYIAMNEEGDWEVTASRDETLEALTDNYNGTLARVVKVVVTMSPPDIPEVSVEIPDDPEPLTQVEANHKVEHNNPTPPWVG